MDGCGPLMLEIIECLPERLADVLPVQLIKVSRATPSHANTPHPIGARREFCWCPQPSAGVRMNARDASWQTVGAGSHFPFYSFCRRRYRKMSTPANCTRRVVGWIGRI